MSPVVVPIAGMGDRVAAGGGGPTLQACELRDEARLVEEWSPVGHEQRQEFAPAALSGPIAPAPIPG
jgi:hypothetical protein